MVSFDHGYLQQADPRCEICERNDYATEYVKARGVIVCEDCLTDREDSEDD
jgi:transcription initiation factor TFIIIB Brf1 subunit/transcription initiation factor TFIIB